MRGNPYQDIALPSGDDTSSSSNNQVPNSRGCKFIDGDPQSDDWAYCGQKVLRPGIAWCQVHYPVIYANSSSKKIGTRAGRSRTSLSDVAKSAGQDQAVVKNGFPSLEDPMLLG